MSEKPSYLGLLNAIAVGEAQAHAYLTEWIATTSNPDVRTVLSTVAAREGEHGMSFAKRINELGYEVRRKDDDGGFAKRMAIAGSDCSDLEKMEQLGTGQLDTGDQPDIFDTLFTDHSIDIATGALLGRYIAEERDSARLLAGCYRALKANERGGSSPKAAAEDRMTTLESKLDAVCAAIGQLQASMSSAANGNGTSNGHGRPASRPRSKAKG